MFLIVTYLFNKCYQKTIFEIEFAFIQKMGKKLLVSIIMTNRYDTQHRTLPVTANKAIMPGLRFHSIPKLQQTQ
jgi:hypothetical protein